MTRRKGYITRQAKRLSTGKINRRRFVMQALTAGVTMPTAMSLATHAEAAQPRKGGLLRHAVTTPDPRQSAAFVTGNALTEVSESGSVRGELAEKIRVSSNKDVWAVNLRDVAFHSGKQLDTRDVAASLEAFLGSHPNDPIATNVARIETEAGRVTFHLREPDAAFAQRLADPRLVIRPLRLDTLDPDNGTGPYALHDARPDRALYTRVENYWKPAAAHLDAVELISLSDAKARQNAILNGDVHVVEGIDPRSVALLQRIPNLEITEHDGTELLGFALLEESTAKAHHLTLALSALLPRQELVTKVLLSHGRPTSGQQDLDAAKAHLVNSGHTGPVLIAADEDAFPGATNAIRLVSTEARKVDVEIQIIDQPAKAHLVATKLTNPDAALGAMFANTITAHVDLLAVRETLQRNPSRLAERGWFL